MGRVISDALQDRIYNLITEDKETGCHLTTEELAVAIVELFEGAAVGLVGNLSEGYDVRGIYADFDDAATCLDGEESWILTLEPELIEKDIDG
jgi:hypothetical protein